MPEFKLSESAQQIFDQLQNARTADLVDTALFTTGDHQVSRKELAGAMRKGIIEFEAKGDYVGRYPEAGQMQDVIAEIEALGKATGKNYVIDGKIDLKAINSEYAKFYNDLESAKNTDKSGAAVASDPVALAQTAAPEPSSRALS